MGGRGRVRDKVEGGDRRAVRVQSKQGEDRQPVSSCQIATTTSDIKPLVDSPYDTTLFSYVPNDDLTLCPSTGEPGAVLVPTEGGDGLLVSVEADDLGSLTLLAGRACRCCR